ncbi:hypothetical protein VOLCADRAFT_99615 [Volvox carteri f. nagariensis]|uniref:RING-type domain-containing protein n=1 Tax=Volvox carteri f. nagariensis TaxID=3068 RepID=D8UI83_VOLCA|nr:uncharacterized protein VOLCADRAFT_99615 [Volvox carteri f. nagariensis]EFJ40583.1 hypothetical protein VOLCADRAFT_99615 [Volvox carteri f. nagariensis]|eukprot:XP_002958361.1 hypothetical protein VOLCADRAFT_99615 [Volvox carteri f. nagariensis]
MGKKLARETMGCGPSTFAVAELNRSLKTVDGPDVLQSKLQTSPWLLSATTAVLSSTAGTPLHTACERKQVEVVQQMLSFLSGASLSVVREALQPYCRRNDLPLPHSVAEGVRIAVGMVNCKGQTPLMCACAAGSPELVKLLMAQGADPWAGDRCGFRTALHYAAMSGSAPCIEALLQNMAVRDMARLGVRYVDVRSVCGLSALHYAAFFDHPAAVEELLRHDPHINAATSSHSYDIFVSCDALSTPLHFAAFRGSVEVVRQLLMYHVQRVRSSSSRNAARTRDPRRCANYGHQFPWQRELVTLLHPGLPVEEVLGLASSRSDDGPGFWASYSDCCCHRRRRDCYCHSSTTSSRKEKLLGKGKRDLSYQVFLQRQLGTVVVGGSSMREGGGERRTFEEAVAEEEEESEEVFCGVCFVEREAVAPAGCGHGLCGRCAERMCRMALGPSSSKPPRPLLCPFCRREVTGFVGLAAREVQPPELVQRRPTERGFVAESDTLKRRGRDGTHAS